MPSVFYRLVDAEFSGPERGCCLTETIFVDECLGDGEAVAQLTEDGGVGDKDVCECESYIA